MELLVKKIFFVVRKVSNFKFCEDFHQWKDTMNFFADQYTIKSYIDYMHSNLWKEFSELFVVHNSKKLK